MGIAEVVTGLMLVAGGALAGGIFGTITLVLLFGTLRLNTKFATNVGAMVGAALGVWFAVVVIQGWEQPSKGVRGQSEQVDENRWLRP